MARYQVSIAYDGTHFSGFQRQAEDRTVQGVFEDALRRIGWEGQTLLGAGRTDAGVHASGQVVAFDLDWRHPQDKLVAALNANLPLDVAVHEVQLARPSFHPRYDALARTYCYRVFSQAVRDPLRERYAWRVWPILDHSLLEQAAAVLPGIHDFAAFGSPPRPGGTTKREVMASTWYADGDEMVFEITANAFLYHMVRRLVSSQVSVGQGKLALDVFSGYLDHPNTKPVKGLAPAHGLTLTKVHYPS